MEPIEGFSNIRGTVRGDPHNKDHRISGSILGFPYFRKVLQVHPDSPDMPCEPRTMPSARMFKTT